MVYFTIQRRPRLSYELGDSFIGFISATRGSKLIEKMNGWFFYFIFVIYTQSVREMLLVRKLDPTNSYMQDVNA